MNKSINDIRKQLAHKSYSQLMQMFEDFQIAPSVTEHDEKVNDLVAEELDRRDFATN
jgi:type III secretory pathway lipoprotein EscJ